MAPSLTRQEHISRHEDPQFPLDKNIPDSLPLASFPSPAAHSSQRHISRRSPRLFPLLPSFRLSFPFPRPRHPFTPRS